MASTRLRKAFKYPSDSSDDDEDIDEEHQERLIADLAAKDATQTAFYRQTFLLVPLASILFTLFQLLFQTPTARHKLGTLLSLTSLVASAYILAYLPHPGPKQKGSSAGYRFDAARGPMERYLAMLNGFLAVTLAFSAGLGASGWTAVSREGLPLVVFGMTMVVRRQLVPLDLEELQKTRFDLKGA